MKTTLLRSIQRIYFRRLYRHTQPGAYKIRWTLWQWAEIEARNSILT